MTAAADHDRTLGKLVSEHKTTSAALFRLAPVMLGSLAVACGFSYVGIFGGDSNIGGRVIMTFFGLLFSLPVGLAVWALARDRGNVIFLHEHGLMMRNAGTESRIRWDDIATYDSGLFLSIGTKKDESFDFGMDSLRAASDVVATLREEVTTKRRVPELLATLRAGKVGAFTNGAQEDGAPSLNLEPAPSGTVDVAGFVMDADGVTPMATENSNRSEDSAEHIPWGAITDCRVEEKTLCLGKTMLAVSYVLVATERKTFRAIMSGTSNRDAMLGLCKAMMVKGSRGNPPNAAT